MASSLVHFYSEDSSEPSPSVFEPAQAAFNQALEMIKQTSTKRLNKRRHILEATTLHDVMDAVATARNRYEKEHSKSKIRTSITELSKRICYYGNVMDVLVQHHPEYVSLAWGFMKLVFGAVVEHENLGRTIITGLCDVADALPRIEIAAYLYPTNVVKQAVSVLYAHIMNFLLRALEWYEEGKIAHAIHSITKPAALRYDDLLKDIARATRRIADSAITSSQAEQRDMHHELQALTLEVRQLKEGMSRDQSLRASTRLEYRHILSDIQLTQALTFISAACSVDHTSSLQASLLLRDKRRFIARRTRCPPFWMSLELHAWNVSQRSSTMTIGARFKNRFYVQDFCINAIEQLRDARIAVLWVLRPREQSYYSAIEVLKSLLHQALTIDYASSHTDGMFPFQVRRFLNAHCAADYVNLLGDSLEHFNLVYIMVDAGAMNIADGSQCRQSLQELLRRLSEHNASTVVKILTLTYGPDNQSPQDKDSTLLKVGSVSRRRGKKLPSEPLQSMVDSGRPQKRRGCMGSSMPFRGYNVRATAG